MKRCSHCHLEKTLGEFNKHETRCKGCVSESGKAYYKKNKEKVLARQVLYRITNKEKISAYHKSDAAKKRSRKRRQENIEECRAKERAYYKANKERILMLEKKWRSENRDAYLEISRRSSEINREKIRTREKAFRNEFPEIARQRGRIKLTRVRSTVKGRLNTRISNGIRDSLKRGKNERHWESLVGYSIDQLLVRLKNTLPTGYDWQDFMDGALHIDHIIPIAVFNFECPEDPDFKHCWSLKNLQLLPAKENLIKSAKLEKPFQPSLAFGGAYA